MTAANSGGRALPRPPVALSVSALALALALAGAVLAFSRMPAATGPVTARSEKIAFDVSSALPAVFNPASAPSIPSPTAAAEQPTLAPTPPPTFVYVVEPGDSLTQLAQRFAVPLPALAVANDLSPAAYLLIGQVLRIPPSTRTPVSATPRVVSTARPTRTPTVPATPVPSFRYVVQSGDSLTELAQRFAVPLPALAAANDLSPAAYLLIGQVLRVPIATGMLVPFMP